MISITVVIGVLAALPGLATAASEHSVSQTAQACAKYENHTYRACTAYVVNAAVLSLVPYYKYGNSGNEARADAALNRLRSRYHGSARRQIITRVSGWPAGENRVSPPRITILDARVNSGGSRATLRTKETWLVRSKRGAIRYREASRIHTVTMQKIEGLIFNKWVVVSIN